MFAKFEAYVAPQRNEIRATVFFNNRRQEPTEIFDNFVTDLKILVKACGYQNEDRMIRDAIVLHAREPKVREKCMDEGNDYEEVQESLKAISQKDEANLHAINKTSRNRKHGRKPKSRADQRLDGKKKDKTFLCQKCGKTHLPRFCPAWGTTCKVCHEKNNWATHCPALKKGTKRHEIETDESTSLQDEFFVEELNSQDMKNEWIIPMEVKSNTTVSFKLDTGAQVNILLFDVYKRLQRRPPLKKTDVKIRGYTGANIPINGRCVTTGKAQLRISRTTFLDRNRR